LPVPAFIDAAASETALRPELVKRDLGHVLRKLEELQEARLKAEAAPKTAGGPTLSAQEREAALGLLRSPDLLGRILADFAACGVVGEETNKLVGYLAAVSRKLDNPLAVIVQSTSAAGKSALMEAVLAFVPPEERVKYSALTGQALYYLGGEANLKNKILAIVEEEGAEKASYALKLLQSEGELSIASTGKDPHTGRMVTQEYRVEGPVMIFLTTTAVDIDEELLNRCLILTVDEGREQTAAIHRLQRERETLAGLLRTEARAAVLALHRNAQRLLRPLRVVNPFAERLTFLDDRTRSRRDHTKYLALIRTVTLLHQHQRPVKTAQHAGRAVEYIEATLDDIAAANRLAHDVLGRTLDEMPPQTRRLLATVEKHVAARCEAGKCERCDVLFTRRELREKSGWGDTQLKVHLGRLVELEYVLAHRADHGTGHVYELVYDGGGKDGRRHLAGLLDVEKLRAGHGYDAERSGVNGERSGAGRPPVGGWSGGGRGAENASSSSETAAPESHDAKNAHWDGAALAVAS
jgi:DNA primase